MTKENPNFDRQNIALAQPTTKNTTAKYGLKQLVPMKLYIFKLLQISSYS